MNTYISFTGALTLIFIVLKLTHVIAWSWWWVLSPILISTGLALVVALVPVLLYGFATIAAKFTDKAKRKETE